MILFWEELNSHCPMPSCTCIPWCRCEAMCVACNERIKDQVIQFLSGLNDIFYVLKSRVLDPLPSSNKVYSLVIQEEINNVVISQLPIMFKSDIWVNSICNII